MPWWLQGELKRRQRPCSDDNDDKEGVYCGTVPRLAEEKKGIAVSDDIQDR